MTLRRIFYLFSALIAIIAIGLTSHGIAYNASKKQIMAKCLDMGGYGENCGCMANLKIRDQGVFGSFLMLRSDLEWLNEKTINESYCSC